MPFSESQLDTWSNQGATASSASTYDSIKTCIDSINWKNDISYEVYLQGSYKNSTNIRGNSDVDIVVEFKSEFYSNMNELPPEQLRKFNEYYDDGKYSLDGFKSPIIEKLNDHYGSQNVVVGNRSIKIKGKSGRLNADVICSADYREYDSFGKQKTNDYVQGIVFWETRTNKKVVNFPIIHYKNGISKNQNASGNYKASIRIIKNMKARMIELGLINQDLAPSYFVESLLFNVPNSVFQKSTYSDIIPGVLNSLNSTNNDEILLFVCQNQQRYLFGTSDQQWNIEEYNEFISQIIDFWNER